MPEENKNIHKARELFTKLQGGDLRSYGGADYIVKEIRSNLSKAGVGSDALDPTGQKTAGELNNALHDATSKLQIQQARELFTKLQAGDTGGYGGADYIVKEIRSNLSKAGVDSAALDPTGRKTADEMNAALHDAASARQPGNSPNSAPRSTRPPPASPAPAAQRRWCCCPTRISSAPLPYTSWRNPAPPPTASWHLCWTPPGSPPSARPGAPAAAPCARSGCAASSSPGRPPCPPTPGDS